MQTLPGFTAEVSLDMSRRHQLWHSERSRRKATGAIAPSFDYIGTSPLDQNADLSDDLIGGTGPAGCRLRPKRCCERDSNGKCRIWVSGCQECP